MPTLKTTAAAAVIAAGAVFASQASAHEVVTQTVTLPVIASGASTEVTLTCPSHHYAVAGGFSSGDRMAPNGPLHVTASYPQTTRTWAVEVTNRSGRPTGRMEASVTMYVTCDRHW